MIFKTGGSVGKSRLRAFLKVYIFDEVVSLSSPVQSHRAALGSSSSDGGKAKWSPPSASRTDGIRRVGYLLPFYLSPFLIEGSKVSRCIYSVLLQLLMWSFHVVPKAVTGLLPLVDGPLLGIMTAGSIASEYLSEPVLSLALTLTLLSAVEQGTDLVPRLSLTLCARYGLRRRAPFVFVCCVAFLGATIASGAALALPLMWITDRVLEFLHVEQLDRPFLLQTPSSDRRPSKRSSDSLISRNVRDAETVLTQFATVLKQVKVPGGFVLSEYSPEGLTSWAATLMGNTGKPPAQGASISTTRKPDDAVASARRTGGEPVSGSTRETQAAPCPLENNLATGRPVKDQSGRGLAPRRSSLSSTSKILQPRQTNRRRSIVDFKETNVVAASHSTTPPSRPSPKSGSSNGDPETLATVNTFAPPVRKPPWAQRLMIEAEIGSSRGRKSSSLDSVCSSLAHASSIGQYKAMLDIQRRKEAIGRKHVAIRSAFLLSVAIVTALGNIVNVARLPSRKMLAIQPTSEPNDPEENIVVQMAARTRLKLLNAPMRQKHYVSCAVSTYLVLFVVSLLSDFLTVQLSFLALLNLAAASLYQLMSRAPRSLAPDGRLVAPPWDVVLIAGGAQAVSRFTAESDVLGGLVRGVSEHFCQQRSALNNQTLFCLLICLLAEVSTVDVISEALLPLAPIVVRDTLSLSSMR
ncbi:hypothetical protein MRX96_034134 [Rhipicephalus microplus]